MNEKISARRKAYIALMRGLMWISAALCCALVLFLIGYILCKGLPNITWELLSTKPSYLSDTIGILPDILNTLYIVIATLVIVLPLGVGAAVYLTEYAQNKNIVSMIEYSAETFSGIPSIIYGLVGMLLFCQSGMGTSLLAGALLFTAGFAHALNSFFGGITSAGATLTVSLYVYAKEQGEFEVAFAIASILMILTFLINLAAAIVGRRLKRRNEE